MENKFFKYLEDRDNVDVVGWTAGLDEITVFIEYQSLISIIEEKAEEYGFERKQKNNGSYEYPASITYQKKE